jgi:hypothetical protein
MRDVYAASADCVANELALHAFVDQQTNPGKMLEVDRRRFLILKSKAERAGKISGLTSAEIGQDLRRRVQVAANKDQQGGVQAAAYDRVTRARKCLAVPAGSTRAE